MKKATLVLVIALLAGLVGCGQKQSISDDIIVVDITKAPASKKELILQDFMDVEYVTLETKDDFLNRGVVHDIGKKTILVTNQDDGDIFVYDRTGNALRKINRRGQGGEEYISCFNITLDEENEEIFINDISLQKIHVYDLYGNFKRSFQHKKGNGTLFYNDIFNYDKNNLICYDQYNEKIPFVLISKKDGSITKEIKIPFKKKILLLQQTRDEEHIYIKTPGPYRRIITFKGNWILSETSSDTVYTLSPDYSLYPLLVRTPSIQTMNPEVFLILRFFSDRYYFMETIKNVFDFSTGKGFSRTFFMYDRQEKAFFNYTVYNGDYTIKKEIYMNWLRPVNHEIESWQALDANQLIESYNNGELKEKLKKIAATLNEDSNPVIMLIKHKK